MSIIFVAGLFALWSSVFAIAKNALDLTTPSFALALRMLMGGTILLGIVLIKDKEALKKLKAKDFLIFSILAVFSVYLSNILEYWGLGSLSSSKACFIYSLSPFFTALLSYIHLKEKMTFKKWIGLRIGFAGMIPVLIAKGGTEESLFSGALFTLPTLALMGAALFGVYGWVILRVVVKDHTTSPLMANTFSMFIGGLLALGHSYFTDTWSPLPVQTSSLPKLLQILAVITLISNVICYNLYGHFLKKYTATFLSFMGLLSPFFAAVYGYFMLGEPILPEILWSSLFVTGGMLLVYAEELKQGYLIKQNAKKIQEGLDQT
jgi:drug/metabolite transporter (DMT)-like permease